MGRKMKPGPYQRYVHEAIALGIDVNDPKYDNDGDGGAELLVAEIDRILEDRQPTKEEIDSGEVRRDVARANLTTDEVRVNPVDGEACVLRRLWKDTGRHDFIIVSISDIFGDNEAEIELHEWMTWERPE